jgi:hypothetical protein
MLASRRRLDAGNFRRTSAAWICLAVAMLAGCGDPDLATVTGRVTLDGNPLPKAFLTFAPTSAGGATSFGKSDENGNYRMIFSDTQSGAWIGPSRVEIRTGDLLPDNSGRIPELVPSVYNTKSTLTADVKSGSNTVDFDLKSNASKIDSVPADL